MQPNLRGLALACATLAFAAPAASADPGTDTFEGQLPPAGRTLTATGFWTGAGAH